jgi:hypothetical protein
MVSLPPLLTHIGVSVVSSDALPRGGGAVVQLVLDLDALLFNRVAHTLKIKGEDYLAFVAVVQNAERGGIERAAILFMNTPASSSPRKSGTLSCDHYSWFYLLKGGCHRNFSIHNTEEHLRLTAARVDL